MCRDGDDRVDLDDQQPVNLPLAVEPLREERNQCYVHSEYAARFLLSNIVPLEIQHS
jgi:hypothetical protein